MGFWTKFVSYGVPAGAWASVPKSSLSLKLRGTYKLLASPGLEPRLSSIEVSRTRGLPGLASFSSTLEPFSFCSYGRNRMFFGRVFSYVFNELLVNTLANK